MGGGRVAVCVRGRCRAGGGCRGRRGEDRERDGAEFERQPRVEAERGRRQELCPGLHGRAGVYGLLCLSSWA